MYDFLNLDEQDSALSQRATIQFSPCVSLRASETSHGPSSEANESSTTTESEASVPNEDDIVAPEVAETGSRRADPEAPPRGEVEASEEESLENEPAN